MGNSPYAVGPVIQALVANGINPLSAEWTKNGCNLLDALLACRLEDGTFQVSTEYGMNMTDQELHNTPLQHWWIFIEDISL